MKETDLESVKEIALIFLNMPIGMTEFSPLIIDHPIFNSAIAYSPEKKRLVNIMENKDDLNGLSKEFADTIKHFSNVQSIFSIIREPYRLVFLKYIKRFLDSKDFAMLLADSWVDSENPNQDKNVSTSMAISWFKKADKKYLMSDGELNVFNNLPENLTIYRGVGVGRKKMGLSWTENCDKADWFAKRFNQNGKQGYLLKAEINKKGILAYFNSRNEDELIVNTMCLKNIKTIKQKNEEN